MVDMTRRGLRGLTLLIGAVTIVACGAASAPQILSTVGSAIGTQDGASAAPSAAEGALGGDDTGTGNEQPPAALRDEARIVYNGSLQLIVPDVDAAIAAGARLVGTAGGYIGASQRTSDGDTPTATITYRIPAERWDATLGGLRALATELVDEQTSAIEVTGQLVDLEARLRNLRATETALQAILAKAERIPDVLEVQRELTSVRGEIERIDAQRASLTEQAAYGTLTATFGVELVAVTQAAKGWDATSEVDRATASLVEVLQGLATAGIWFGIAWLPILLVFGAVLALAVIVLRRLGIIRRTEAAGA